MKIEYARLSVPIFPWPLEVKLPELPISIAADDYSLYKGVLVLWDEDHDERLLTFIDDNLFLAPRLLAAYERKASLSLVWLNEVPQEFELDDREQVEVAGDCWQVESAVTSAEVWLPFIKELIAG